MSAADRERAAAAAQVVEFIRKKKLTLDDLIDVGGAELKSPDPKRAEKARRVSTCWELMARVNLKYRNLEQSEQSARPIPALGA